MRVVITTAGSRGDVAPYTGLALALQGAGHDVTLATHGTFREFVEARGIGFAELAGDPQQLMFTKAGQRFQRSGAGVVSLAHLVRLMRPYAREMAERGLAAVQGADVVLCSSLTAPVYHLGQGLGIPTMGAYLQPTEPTGEFASFLFGGRSFGRVLNRASALVLEAGIAVPFTAETNRARRSLGLPPISWRGLRRELATSRWPVRYGFSPSVVPQPRDWRPGLEVVGYWWPAPDPAWTPPPALLDFLAAGDPPVFVGFGSMRAGTDEAGRLGGVAMEALRAVGARGVLQSGWSGLGESLQADDMITVGEVPHEWLFPRMAAVVHHAGAGTTAAALRAGVPAVPVPVLADQPFWANRIHGLGVAATPIPFRRLSASRLVAGLTTVLRDPLYRARAAALAERIGTEDGAAAVVREVERLGERGGE